MAEKYGGWLGILKWSLQQNDGTRPSEFAPMPEEEKKWLMDALESMTVDEAKAMAELVEIIAAPESPPDASAASSASLTSQEMKLNALAALQELVENLDNAKNLFVMGGFTPLLACLQSSASDDVRGRVCDVITECVQNNPKAQEWAMKSAAFPVLIAAFTDAWPRSIALAASVMTALSSLVRGSTEGQRMMLAHLKLVLAPVHDAPDAAGMTGKARRLLRKALLFASHMLRGSSAERAKAIVLREHVPPILRVLHVEASTRLDDDDADARLCRVCALDILDALVGVTEDVGDVVDDSDRRTPAGFKPTEVAAAAPAAPLLLGDAVAAAAASSSAAVASVPVRAVSSAAGDSAVFSQSERLRLVQESDAAHVLQALRTWLDTQIAAQTSSGGVADVALYTEERDSVVRLLATLSR